MPTLMRVVAALLLTALLVACAHTINPVSIEQSPEQTYRSMRVAVFLPATATGYVYKHRRGTDVWTFQVGAALQELTESLVEGNYVSAGFIEFLSSTAVVDTDRTVAIELSSFEPKVGLFQFLLIRSAPLPDGDTGAAGPPARDA